MTASNYSDNQKWTWLLDNSQIAPGRSAILNNNTIVFYGIHYTGILAILATLVSCASVLISVCRSNSKKRSNWDFSLCISRKLHERNGEMIWHEYKDSNNLRIIYRMFLKFQLLQKL